MLFVCRPFDVGAKVTSKLQESPGFMEPEQGVKKEEVTVKSPAACGATFEMITDEVLLLVRVMKFAPLTVPKFCESPIATVPKSRGGAGVTAKPPLTTTPFSARVVDFFTLFPRSAVTNRFAVYVPTVPGAVNVRAITQVLPGLDAGGITAPAAQVVAGEDAIEKSEASVPVREITVMVSGPLPVFVSVTFCAGVVVVLGN